MHCRYKTGGVAAICVPVMEAIFTQFLADYMGEAAAETADAGQDDDFFTI